MLDFQPRLMVVCSRSVKISKNKVYRIGMVLNKVRKDGNITLNSLNN